jgi:ribonuclease VapC
VIVDTSALVAILRAEPDAAVYADALAGAGSASMSAGTYVELGAVVDGVRDPVVSRRLDELLDRAGIRIEPLTAEQARIARRAYQDFGRGSGHPARLNFGDCLSYGLAQDRGEPLLFKGDDFPHTDVTPAV